MNTDGETNLSTDPRVDDAPVVDLEEQMELFDDE
jgi:hypothetical protein